MKCIRCGFCLDACPTFRLTGRETFSPRGRIYLIRSWNEGVVDCGPDVVEALDTCLGCRACETACPSGVEYGAILELARARMQKERRLPPRRAAARHALLSVLTRRNRLALALRLARAVPGLGRHNRMPGLASRLLSGSSRSAAALPTAQSPQPAPPPLRSPPSGACKHTVGVLTGCVMSVLFSNTEASTVRLLQAAGCEVIAPPEAGCCGALHLHTGFADDAKRLMRAFLDAWRPFLDEIETLVVNSAGCGSTLKEYGELLADDPAYGRAARAMAEKTKDVCEWLAEIGLPTAERRLDAVVTYHDACHLAHGQRIRLQPRALLRSIPGLNLVEMEESDTCCGSAGIYNITQPEMACRLLERKLANLKATGASIVATGNPGCLSWMEQGAREAGMKIRVAHTVDLLAEAVLP